MTVHTSSVRVFFTSVTHGQHDCASAQRAIATCPTGVSQTIFISFHSASFRFVWLRSAGPIIEDKPSWCCQRDSSALYLLAQSYGPGLSIGPSASYSFSDSLMLKTCRVRGLYLNKLVYRVFHPFYQNNAETTLGHLW